MLPTPCVPARRAAEPGRRGGLGICWRRASMRTGRAAAGVQDHPRRGREKTPDQLLHAGELQRPGGARKPALFVIALEVREDVALFSRRTHHSTRWGPMKSGKTRGSGLGGSASLQETAHGEVRVREREGAERAGGGDRRLGIIRSAWIAEHGEPPLLQVDHPVLGHLRLSIEPPLVLQILGQAAIRELDKPGCRRGRGDGGDTRGRAAAPRRCRAPARSRAPEA